MPTRRAWPASVAAIPLLLGVAPSAPVAAAEGDPVVVAAGDIVCGPTSPSEAACRDEDTAALVRQLDPAAVLALGDLQYESGALADFRTRYDSTWGTFLDRTRPVPGNHEYGTTGASGYFDYFGDRAGVRGEGWYSFDVGAWHVVALNSNCAVVGCGPGSRQEQWLRADLAASRRACTLAYWHHPAWTSSDRGPSAEVLPLVSALGQARADVLLVGHHHFYERFAPRNGLRQFIVGTGGKDLHAPTTRAEGSEVIDSTSFGVLELTLRASSYDWRFRSVAGSSFTDTGTASCQPKPDRQGYRFAASDGGVFAFGGSAYFGSTGDRSINSPIVAMAGTPADDGYWLVAADGGAFAFGQAAFLGSTGDRTLNRPIVAAMPTPSGRGYWLVASDGGVFTFGDAAFHGSTGGGPLNRPIVAAMATPSGGGYWLVASDGGVFAFGDAVFLGSTGGQPLNRPIVAAMAAPSGRGYSLVASDGGVFTFGDAAFHGSTGGGPLNRPIVAAASTASGAGYWLVASDGGVFAFGDARFLGSTGDRSLNRPIVAAAAAS